MITFIDTHAHIDGEEFAEDREQVIARAQEAGISKIFVPAIDLSTSQRILRLCQQYPGYLYPMVGLHPEEVRADYQTVLEGIKALIPPLDLQPLAKQELSARCEATHSLTSQATRDRACLQRTPNSSETACKPIAIGEVGLDYYWSREFEQEQLAAFEKQVEWSIVTRLPLMIHCRKAQNEMVHLLKRYERELPGGVFHCFTGNEYEAVELLQFDRFVLGVGGVLTFKKSHLPEVLPSVVPLDRIVLETDSPYMAPVPHRGQRNEPSFVSHVLERMAEAYQISPAQLAAQTNQNVERVFHFAVS